MYSIIRSEDNALSRSRHLFLLVLFLLLCPPLQADETDPEDAIVGAGAHFSWIIFHKMKDELEAKTNRQLVLYGEGSMLGVGCNAGIKNALKNKPGHETFGFVCCPLADEEVSSKNIIVYPIALEPVLTIVNENNPINNLSADQIRAIFKGDITNWKEVGGFDKPIIVVARLHCKMRPGHWKTILPSHKEFREDRLGVTSASEMVDRINSLPNAIGHIGATWDYQETDQVKSIAVDGFAPTAENLKNKKYPFFRNLSAVTNQSPSEDILSIIRYARTSPAFFKLAKKYELLPLEKMSAD